MAQEFFISYSHTDRPWAERLAADLRGRGATVFFDQHSLRDGEGWEAQLREAVMTSKYLVCLWSAAAMQSEWVQQELAVYRVMNPPGTSTSQKVLMVPLDAQRHTFSQTQHIDLAPLKAAYAGAGANSVAANDWLTLVNRVMAVRAVGASLRIPVALLTLESNSAVFSPADLTDITNQLGLTQVELQGRYGPRRLDWRPFTGGDTIEAYLDQSRADINRWLAAPRGVNESIDWEYPDDARFWTDQDYVREFAGMMEGGLPGLIVIDPVATLQRDVQARLALFARCLRFENVAIVALHPSPATQQDTLFREWVAKYTVALLDAYVAPRPVPDMAVSARLGIGVDDMKEMRRMLKTSIGDCLRRRSTGAAPAAAAIRN